MADDSPPSLDDWLGPRPKATAPATTDKQPSLDDWVGPTHPTSAPILPPPLAAPVAAPAATPVAPAVPPGPVAPPIYTAPTTPLIRPGGGGAPASFTAYGSSPATATPNIYGSSPQAALPPATTMPAPGVGPSTPAVTPGQINYLTGLGEGAKRAIDVPAELLAGGGNWLGSGANRLMGGMPARLAAGVNQMTGNYLSYPKSYADTRADDLAADAAYQAQLGNDPNAAAGFRGGQAIAPLAVGGAGVNLLKLGGLGGRFLAGTAAEDVPGILGWVGRRLSGATGGALQGGATTAMTGDPNTPVGERALPGAVAGAGLGSVVLPTLSSATNWVANRFGSATTPAAQQIIRAMTRDNMTPGQLDSAITALGPQASLADVSSTANIRSLAETVANSPGPAAQQARQFLTKRAEGQTQRLDDAVKTATDAQGGAFDTMEQLQATRRAEATPAYNNFYNNTTVTPEQAAQFRPFIENPIGQQALQHGIDAARYDSIAQGKPFNPADYGVTQADNGAATVLSPTSATPQMLDAVKRGYDQVLEQYRNPVTGKLDLSGNPTATAINNMRASFVGQLRNQFPQYAEALDKWAGPSQDMDALSMGRRVLTTDPDVTANSVANLSDSQKQMYNVGMAQAMKDRIAATPDDADATRRLFGNNLIRSKIAAGFGGPDTDAFQNFQNTVNNEAAYAATRRDILGGSPTARRLAGMADQAQSPDIVTPLLHLVHGNVGAAAGNIVHQLGAGAGRWAMLPTEAQQQALGELLFSQGPGAQNRLMQAITPGGAAAIRSQLQNALTGYPGVYAGINALSPSMADRLRNPPPG